MKRGQLFPVMFAIAVIIPFQYGYPQSAQEKTPPTPAASTLTVPTDTTIPLRLLNTINSRTTQPGQALYCETIFPITVGNRIVIPVGSSVKGSVTKVVRPGHSKGKAQIGIRFETLILPKAQRFLCARRSPDSGAQGGRDTNPRNHKSKALHPRAKTQARSLRRRLRVQKLAPLRERPADTL